MVIDIDDIKRLDAIDNYPRIISCDNLLDFCYTTVYKKKDLMKEIKSEIDSEYLDSIKSKVKRKYKQVQMAKITLQKLEKELDEMFSGKKKFTEEELLFDGE